MTRKYMNDRWCVRCSRLGPTPYLRNHWQKLLPRNGAGEHIVSARIMDIGCGNGRNVEFMRRQGYTNTVAFDMANDYGYKITLGRERFPLLDDSVSVVLANYVFMFLDPKERKQVIKEIKRLADPGYTGCRIMVELYPAKDSFAKTDAQCTALQKELFEQLGWYKVLYSKHRFIARNH